MKAILLMLGAFSAAIIFVGCGTAVGRATGVETSEVEQVIDEKQLAIDIQRTCRYEMNKARRPGGLLYRSPGENLNKWMEDCIERLKAEALAGIGVATEVERAVEEAEQELEVVRAGAEEVVQARLGERNEVESKLDICKNDTAMILVNGRETKSVATNTLKMCLDKVAAEHGLVTTDAELERAIEEAEQEMEIVKAGAEEVLAERDIQQACSHEFQIAISPGGKLYPSTRNIEVLEEYFSECIPRMELELASEGGTDVEKAAEAVEQEMEIVKAGAEQVVEEKAMVEDLQNKCLSEFNSAKNRYGIGGTPRLNINQFMTECMNEGSKDLAVLGDIDVDVEKAIEEAEQEMEIVKAGAEDVFEERVASLEEKVAELTKLLEALQTQ